MNNQLRNHFDDALQAVLGGLPETVRQLLEEVPLVVEDFPSRDVQRHMGVARRDQLCGLYTGIPLTERSVQFSGVLSDVIHIYREGILSMAATRDGIVDDEELSRQIRITVLHELGHHHGLDEDELRELGY